MATKTVRVTVEFEMSDYIQQSGDSPEQVFRDCVTVNALSGSLDMLCNAHQSKDEQYIEFCQEKAKLIKSLKIVSP